VLINNLTEERKVKKMSALLVMIALSLCVVACCVLTYQLGLWPTHPPQRNFSSDELLLSEQDLGPHYKLTNETKNEGTGIRIETAHRDFEMVDDQRKIVLKIEHFVYRFDNKQHARNYFNSDGIYFKPIPIDTAFFHPRYADKWIIADGGTGYWGVYDEFLISFHVKSFDAQGARQPDSKVVEYITYDSRFAHFLTRFQKCGNLAAWPKNLP
jgi:hypothetical protein